MVVTQLERGRTPDVSSYLGVGLTLALSTLLFLWLGTRVDAWLGSRPAFTLIGAFIGAAAGFYHMIHHLIVVPRRRAQENGRKGQPDSTGRERQ